MALLSSEVKDELTRRLLEVLSARWEEVPIGHQQVRAMIDTFDGQLDICEQGILTALPTAVRAWLTTHQAIARRIVVAVEQARKEEL